MGSHRARRDREQGFSFAELAFGLLILAIAASVLVNHLTVNYQSTALERDRVFAFSKAQALLAEIQGYVDRGQAAAAVDLDALDDGVVNKPTLTIQKDVFGALVLPDHVLSGNTMRNGDWLWSRRVTVQPFQGRLNRNVRYVTARIYKRDYTGRDLPVADLSAVINSSGVAFPTTQVFDMYLLAVENIPGWWVYMDSIRPFVESTITDLETRNPGLSIRTHWITKASYGRNEAYRPYVNDAVDSNQDISEVYYYPGRMPVGSASTFYYVPDNFRAHINLDGNDVNGEGPLNPVPYALADVWNHAMRYPDEVAFHQRRVDAITAKEAEIAAAKAASLPPPAELTDMSKEPTLRMFFEDLNTNPAKYRNALIINLHGELLPMPPLRNSSDPAREPSDPNLRGLRVVTHPEELRTRHDAGGTDPVRLRVYAFTDNAMPLPGGPIMPAPIAVEIMGVDLRHPVSANPIVDPSVLVDNLRGGVMAGFPASNLYGPFAASKWESSPPGNPTPPLNNEMYYRVQFVDPGAGQEKFSRILLFNTPVVAGNDAAGKGVNNNEKSRLYGMEYVPGCPETAAPGVPNFARDLNTAGAGPKNTARWRITLPGMLFANGKVIDNNGTPVAGDVLLKIRTRIWTGADPANSGTFWPAASRNQPENLSTTYTWWTDSLDDVPITERSQFNGDPRHNPYKDLLNVASAEFRNGYNWFHDALNNSGENARLDNTYFDGAARLLNRWRGRMSTDVPRYMELLRNGLVASRCVYTTLTGFSYYYLGLGNDIGYDAANGYPSSIPCNLRPMGNPGATGFVNTITGARTLVRGTGAAGNYWTGLPWLGELYPDSEYAQWTTPDASGNWRGNLAAGTAASTFRQGAMGTTYQNSNRTAFGTLMADPIMRTQEEGCTSLFNIGTSASTFHHLYSAGNGNLTGAGPQIANNYHFNMPVSAPISRPFSLASNASGGTGDEFSLAPYLAARGSATMLRTYYDHPSGYTGSGVVKLLDNAGTNAAYIVVNGIDKTVDSGSAFIARFSVLSLVHSFFESGDAANLQRIQQPARVEIESPTDITELANPVTIPVLHRITWTRWDGQPYTATTTATETEAQLEYVITYSKDGGATWRYVQDDTVATPGTRPAAVYLVPDAGAGQETYTWSVPAASFPEGSYLLQVECYRLGSSIHYSFHKSKLFIKR